LLTSSSAALLGAEPCALAPGPCVILHTSPAFVNIKRIKRRNPAVTGRNESVLDGNQGDAQEESRNFPRVGRHARMAAESG
jgi:hypothetical protein